MESGEAGTAREVGTSAEELAKAIATQRRLEAQLEEATVRLRENLREALQRSWRVTPENEDEILDKAIGWLRERWGDDITCPYCKQGPWEVGTPVELPTVDGENLTPMFPVMCKNCGHTTFVNALRAGVFAEPEEQPRDDTPEGRAE